MPSARQRRRLARPLALAAALLALPAAGLAQPVVPSPPSPTSRVLWQHDGAGVTWFEVRVDGLAELRVEAGEPPPGGEYEAPLPLMLPGLRTLVVAACNESGCAGSAPLVVLAVAAPIRWLPAARVPD
jgi:hypothetical protein